MEKYACLHFFYISHIRSFVYDFIVTTKYKITTLPIFLNVYTHILYSLYSPALSTHFFHLCGKQSITALHSSLLRWCKEAVTAVLIMSSNSNCIPRRCSKQVQTISNHMEWDLESRKDVPKSPSTNAAADLANHDGDETLNCHGATWHHVQAVLVVYDKQLASSYPARVHSNIGQRLSYQLARMIKHESILAEEQDTHDFQSTLTAPNNFHPQWHLGTPFSIPLFQLTVKWMQPWLSNR